MPTAATTAEHARLAEATGRAEDDLFSANPWYEWGPYLSERAWGTVREDYSEGGDAWDYFPHDHARSRAYRWNEDGMAGISDIRHELCLALALWNGNDPILKERMFGLTGPQGNHGEDVKEYWWYLEGLPSHALLKWRYHYPQAAFPYEQLVHHGRGLHDPELELLDTGVFDDDRYWSVDVTYAKASPTEVLMRIEVENHGPDEATIDVLPTLWFRNTWSWGDEAARPRIEGDGSALVVSDHELAGYRLEAAPGPDGAQPEALFCENETNAPRIFGSDATTPYPKDGINDHVVSGAATVNPEGVRHEGCAALPRDRAGRAARPSCGCGCTGPRDEAGDATWAGAAFDEVVAAREADADEFYGALAPAGTHAERMRILRQACAGLVWSKQMYPYNVRRWLDGDPGEPPPPDVAPHGRNSGWRHLDSFDVLAMPDPWEYPWFAAWDLGFHCDPVGAPRPGVREVPAARAAARVVPASERRAAGLRVELRRRQPAGARDGRAARVPHRRRQRPRVPRADLPEAADQLHVVAQPRGRRRQQRLQRRLPRPRQHQPDRPLEPAGGRRARAGRRHGVDGLLRAVDARDRARARAGERRLPGHGDQVPRAVRPGRARARAAGPLRPRRRLLLRPARVPVGRDHPGEGADDLGAAPAAPGRRLPPKAVDAAVRLGKRFARLRDS